MELSNDVHFAIAVHQKTSQCTEDIYRSPDIRVKCFRNEMVLQFSSEVATKTVIYFEVGKGTILASYMHQAFLQSTSRLQ